MQYRITYQAEAAAVAETMIVTSITAVFALVDYANKWHATIHRVEERATRTRAWKPSSITQQD